MTPRALILTGAAACVVALALATLGVAIRGPLNPECERCAPLAGRALLLLALPVAILGAVLAAIGLARREGPGNLEGSEPPSPPR
jgi:hypothetical protein